MEGGVRVERKTKWMLGWSAIFQGYSNELETVAAFHLLFLDMKNLLINVNNIKTTSVFKKTTRAQLQGDCQK